jgi:zinc/manganese transport system substrate-binding protein
MRLSAIGVALLAALPFVVPGSALAAGPVGVVAAENFYGDLANEIGGDHVKVTSILSSPDDDPHLFESSPSTARAIAGAEIVIYNGADYDPWMDKLLSASPNQSRTSIVAAQLSGSKSGDNPHLWYEPKTLPEMAAALAAELGKRDPANAAAYKANLEKFDASLKPVAAEIAKIKAAKAGLKVTATEPVFGYMAAALGFDMLNYNFQVAMMNDTEPSPSDVAAFEQSLKSGEAKILFYNSQVTDDTTNRLLKLAGDSHVRVIGVTETEPGGKTIATWFLGQLQQIEAALNS